MMSYQELNFRVGRQDGWVNRRRTTTGKQEKQDSRKKTWACVRHP
jgi:hypothetical protein